MSPMLPLEELMETTDTDADADADADAVALGNG